MPHSVPSRRRGYFGVGIYHAKTEANVGTLLRHATLYGAAFVFTIGPRYRRQASDTCDTTRHVPLFEHDDLDSLIANLPYGCPLVGIELDPRARVLGDYAHPERAAYLLGAEDHGLPPVVTDRCHSLLRIPTPGRESMNVAVAGTLVMHDRYMTREHGRIEVSV